MADVKSADVKSPPTERKAPSNAAGVRARTRIVEAALRILKRDGYHSLSMRLVARDCGMRFGNLTYHFPNKRLLVAALVDNVFEGYEERFEVGEAAGAPGNEKPIEELVDWLLRDATKPETHGLFKELWVLARHDPFAAESVRSFYEKAARSVAATLGACYPQVSEEDLLRAAYFIGMLSEGTGVIFGEPTEQPVQLEDVLPTVRRCVLDILSKASTAGD